MESFVSMEPRPPQKHNGPLIALLAAAIAVTAIAGYVVWQLFFSEPDLPARPTQDIYVTDRARIIDDSARQQMLTLGREMDRRFGAQLVVVTLDTLDGEDIREYANKLFRAWGIGDKEKNNGVLLLIAKNDRKFRIEVGYGLEGSITDGYAGSVLDRMKPDFKQEKYSPAILQAYALLAAKIYAGYGEAPPQALTALLAPAKNGEQLAPQPSADDEDDELDLPTIIGIIVLLLICCFIVYLINRAIGGFFYLLGSGGPPGGPYNDGYGGDSFGDSFGGGDSGGGGADDGW